MKTKLHVGLGMIARICVVLGVIAGFIALFGGLAMGGSVLSVSTYLSVINFLKIGLPIAESIVLFMAIAQEQFRPSLTYKLYVFIMVMFSFQVVAIAIS